MKFLLVTILTLNCVSAVAQTKDLKTDSVFNKLEAEGFPLPQIQTTKPLIIIESYLNNKPLTLTPVIKKHEVAYDSLSKINPDDIESIHVLKGKQATDAYGLKGENGVIVIRLK